VVLLIINACVFRCLDVKAAMPMRYTYDHDKILAELGEGRAYQRDGHPARDIGRSKTKSWRRSTKKVQCDQELFSNR
jgi:hypothetical protein